MTSYVAIIFISDFHKSMRSVHPYFDCGEDRSQLQNIKRSDSSSYLFRKCMEILHMPKYSISNFRSTVSTDMIFPMSGTRNPEPKPEPEPELEPEPEPEPEPGPISSNIP